MNETRRFTNNEIQYMPHPQVRHFLRLDGYKDRFENRIFPAEKHGILTPGYYDREGRQTQAAILISPDGDRFIKRNPGILHSIEKGLKEIVKGADDVELDRGRKMSRLTGVFSVQSLLSTLSINNDKYFIKIHAPSLPPRDNLSQPFINEMLEVQAIQTDLREALTKISITFPTYYFASGQVLCRGYENGLAPSPTEDILKRIFNLSRVVNYYIGDEDTDKKSLWHNIELDLLDGFLMNAIRCENFIERSDGLLSWIDPFLHS